jgi:hypothetical protein
VISQLKGSHTMPGALSYQIVSKPRLFLARWFTPIIEF